MRFETLTCFHLGQTPIWKRFCDPNGTYKKCHGGTKNVYFYRNNFTDESIRNSDFNQHKLKQGWGHLPALVIWGKKIEGWGNWISFKPNGQRTTGCSEQTKQEALAQIKWRWQMSLVLGLFLAFILSFFNIRVVLQTGEEDEEWWLIEPLHITGEAAPVSD